MNCFNVIRGFFNCDKSREIFFQRKCHKPFIFLAKSITVVNCAQNYHQDNSGKNTPENKVLGNFWNFHNWQNYETRIVEVGIGGLWLDWHISGSTIILTLKSVFLVILLILFLSPSSTSAEEQALGTHKAQFMLENLGTRCPGCGKKKTFYTGWVNDMV